ncbi:MAG: Ig-like domain-containing protein, partial [Actinomycetota bacterium]
MVFAAVVAEGRAGSESSSNDGGAWLLNRSEASIGHVNRVVGEVDSTAGPFSGTFDVDQSESVVVVNDVGTGQAVLIDTALAEPGAPVAIGATTEVRAAPGAVILAEPQSGRLWRLSREGFGTVQNLDDVAATLQSSPGMVYAVGRQGLVAATDPALQQVYLVEPGIEPIVIEVEDWGDAIVTDATFADDVAAFLFDDGRLLTARDGDIEVLAPSEQIVLLQQSSTDDTGLVGITAEGAVIRVDLQTGDHTVIVDAIGASPIAPIWHNGCVYSVTFDPSPVFHYCGRSTPLQGAGPDIKLTLVNDWVWVNDVQQGAIWFVREDDLEVEQVSDWSAALNLNEVDEELEDADGGEEELVESADADELTDQVDELDEDDRNTPPVAEDDEAFTRRGRAVVIPVLENDFDEDNDPLSVDQLRGVDADGVVASGAQVSITADGAAIQVVPPEDFVGNIRFGYVVHDGRQGRDEANVELTVNPPDESTNRPPVTTDDNATVRAGRSVALNVLSNDTDPDGDVLVLLAVDDLEGAVNFGPDGEVSYAPDVTSTEGTIALSYVVADDFGAEATGTIRVRVRGADTNQPPQARNDIGRTAVGQPVIIDVLANDMDPDGDPLSVQSLQPLDSPVTTAQLTSDGRFLFRPETPGSHRFTYAVSDGPEVDQAQIRVDAEEVEENRPPVAVLDEVALARGESRLVRVLDNDGDPDGDVVGIVEWFGTEGLEIAEVPGVGFNVLATPTAEPRESFRYWISDGVAPPVRGTVIVSVLDRDPVDYPPVATADSVDVRAGQTSTLRVLRNDYDPEGRFLRVVGPLPDIPEGLLRLSPDQQTVLLTVNEDQLFGFDFSYDIEDPGGNRDSAVVTVRIVDPNLPNRAPIAGPDVARTPAGAPVVIPVLNNDVDPDGDPITIESIAQQPRHGTVEILEDGTIQYEPESGFAGTDTFLYTLVDGYAAPPESAIPADQRGPGRALGEVFVGVMPEQTENRPPTAIDDTEFPPIQIGGEPVVLNVLANDSDPDDDPLTVTEVTIPAVGEALVVGGGGSVEFIPPADGENRDVSFTYHIADGNGGTASAQILLSLVGEPEPLPPVAADDTVGPARAGDVVTFDPRENDSDPDGDAADLIVIPEDDLLVVGPDGRVELTVPDTTSDLRYRVEDPQGLRSEVAFITVLVTENEAPVVESVVLETEYNTPLLVSLHDYASDPDDDPLVITLGQQRAGGSVTVVGQPADDFLEVEFLPDTDFEGAASFDFTVDDLQGHTVSGGVSITVLPPENRPPELAPLSIDAEAGTPTPVRLTELITDPDPDGADQHEISVSSPANGNVSLQGPDSSGVVTISTEITAGDSSDSFEYTVVDGEFTVSNTVSINVLVPSYSPPTLTEDTARVLQGETAGPIDLLANDVDNSPAAQVGDGLLVTQVGVADGGTTSQDGNTATFVPDTDFFGTTTFTYTVQDGRRSIEGESVGQVTVEVIGRPDAPQPPTVAEEGNGYLLVEWSQPSQQAGQAAVTGYVLEYTSQGGAADSIDFATQQLSHRWEGLTNGDEYCFRVAAVNEAGQGDFSETGGRACGIPDVTPEQPGAPSVEFGNTQLTVTWTPPLNQGTPIKNYQLRIGGGLEELSPELGVTESYTWTGLQNGTDYNFQVRAQNSADDNDGWSEWSTVSDAEHPLTLPDAPGQPSAVRGDRQVQVTWNAPYDGGDTISAYQVRSSLGSEWVDVTPQGVSNSYTWRDIQNGVGVSFEVRAI